MIKLNEKELKEKEKYFYSYMDSGNNASKSEVDPNSNVTSKSVATFGAENNKDINKQINIFILGNRIEKLFGKEAKENFYQDMSNDIIYLHDASSNSAGVPYCVAIDLHPFIMHGDIPLGGNSKAPKHLASFCGAYVNLIFLIAGQFAGACADVSLLTYFDYFARKDYGDDYLNTHTKIIENHLQQLIYTINAPSGGRGQQSVFYNTSIFDKNYFDSLLGGMVMPDFTHPKWESVEKLQKFFMKWFNKERTKALLTFPVITVAFQTKDGKPKDEQFEDFIAEEMSEGNSFFLYSSDSVDSLSSCCRLKNEIERDENNFTYTLGGTGLATGSKKVITINFNRLIQKNYNLEELVKRIHKYLVAFDDILYEEKEKGMLPVYDEGYISLDKQYLTIGVNGMVEGAEYLGLEISDNEEYKEWIKGNLSLIKKLNKEEARIYSEKFNRKTRFNTEFVPAESLGVRFAKKDKAEGLKVNRDCYNSYFYKVEDESLDIFDKFNLYAKDIIDWLDGGSAYHMNISEIPSKETWKKIIEYSTKIGCNYWTYNCLATCCEESDCGYINKNTTKSCVMCGSKNISYATRVIGYLKKISHFSEDRQKEAGLRIYKKI